MKYLLLIIMICSTCFAFPVAHWKLDEHGITTIRDSAGTNDGTWVGTELVTNGSLDTDTGWAKGDGWTIDSGNSNVAECDGSQVADTSLTQVIDINAGKSYTIQYTYTRTAGTIRAELGGAAGSVNSATGPITITEIIAAQGANLFIGLVGDDSFIGTINDVSVREHVDSVPSPAGSGLLFDGVDDKVTVPADSAIDAFGKTALTVVGWINTDSSGRIIGKQAAAGEGYDFYLAGGGVNLHVIIGHTGTSAQAAKTGSVSQNKWNHVGFVYNEDSDKKIKLYINGVLLTSLTIDTAGIGTIKDDSAVIFHIGEEVGGANNFDGSISDVRIYDIALTGVEITGIMNTNNRRSRRRPR